MVGNEFLVQVLHAYNKRRSTEEIRKQEIEKVDSEFTIIRSYIENLFDDNTISDNEKKASMIFFLYNIKGKFDNKVKNDELIRLTELVCEDLELNNVTLTL